MIYLMNGKFEYDFELQTPATRSGGDTVFITLMAKNLGWSLASWPSAALFFLFELIIYSSQ